MSDSSAPPINDVVDSVVPLVDGITLDAASSSKIHTLICKDDVEIEVSEKVIRQSMLFNELLGCTDDNAPIPVEVTSRPMKAIIEYLELYKDDPPYIPPEGYNCEMTERDIAFFDKVADDDLVEFLNAGNYLNVQRFTDAGLMKIRGWLEGKNEAEIRYILQVPDDYTDEEKEAMYQEYSFFDPSQAVVQDEQSQQ